MGAERNVVSPPPELILANPGEFALGKLIALMVFIQMWNVYLNANYGLVLSFVQLWNLDKCYNPLKDLVGLWVLPGIYWVPCFCLAVYIG